MDVYIMNTNNLEITTVTEQSLLQKELFTFHWNCFKFGDIIHLKEVSQC